jgi:uncharacterized protein YjiS (DUF1127 family)
MPIGVERSFSSPSGATSFERFFHWIERIRQRHMLASLDDRMLKDIGLSRSDVVREVSKPFWQY